MKKYSFLESTSSIISENIRKEICNKKGAIPNGIQKENEKEQQEVEKLKAELKQLEIELKLIEMGEDFENMENE